MDMGLALLGGIFEPGGDALGEGGGVFGVEFFDALKKAVEVVASAEVLRESCLNIFGKQGGALFGLG